MLITFFQPVPLTDETSLYKDCVRFPASLDWLKNLLSNVPFTSFLKSNIKHIVNDLIQRCLLLLYMNKKPAIYQTGRPYSGQQRVAELEAFQMFYAFYLFRCRKDKHKVADT
jgi:hypothetical protein